MNKVLITGATGFIGGRLAEIACARGIQVRALVRDWSRAARLSRLKLEMVQGDMLKPDTLRSAMQDCDAVFHCAVDNRAAGEVHRTSSAEGTRNVMQAALDSKIGRVIHLSSIAVYGYKLSSDADAEDRPYRYTGDAYCDGKIDAEKIALEYAHTHNLPVTVLRPTIVYGPFGAWTADTVKAIKKESMVLVDGGKGICNALYIDNLVEAMLLAAQTGRAAGEVFHVSDADAVTWKDFIQSHARAIGDEYVPVPVMSTEEIRKTRETLNASRPSSLQQLKRIALNADTIEAVRNVPAIAKLESAARVLARHGMPRSARTALRAKLNASRSVSAPSKATVLLSEAEVDLQSANVVFNIDKARRVLGYDPKIDFSEGMRRTSAWIRWARI